jgi:hypothetical protein
MRQLPLHFVLFVGGSAFECHTWNTFACGITRHYQFVQAIRSIHSERERLNSSVSLLADLLSEFLRCQRQLVVEENPDGSTDVYVGPNAPE